VKIANNRLFRNNKVSTGVRVRVSFNVGVVFACSTNDIMLTQDHGDNSLLLLLVIFTCLLATQQASHGVSQSKASAMWMI